MEFGTGFTWWYVGIGVVISIIGAALWDWALKPLFSRIGRISYSVVSLGRQSAVDRIYKQAARQDSQIVSWELFLIVTAFLGSILFLLVLIIYLNPASDPFDITSSLEKSLDDCTLRPEEDLADCRNDAFDGALVLPRLMMIPGFVILFIVLFYKLYFVSAVNNTVTAFRQKIRVCAPSMNATDIRLLRRDFALMQSEGDHKKLQAQLLSVIEDNDLTLPVDD